MPGPSAEPLTAGDLLTLEELAHFRRTSILRGAGLVVHAWGTIAGVIALYLLWPSALTLGVTVVVVGARQLGLLVLMHEAAHWLLFPHGRLTTWVGTWLCGAPVGADLRAYRSLGRPGISWPRACVTSPSTGWSRASTTRCATLERSGRASWLVWPWPPTG